jgi:NAD(P)-dependent dehydrogenase (short-subunit alcohol dehydrogenase family)
MSNDDPEPAKQSPFHRAVAEPRVRRTVLVTGAARGLGAAMADGFAAAGCLVVRTDRHHEEEASSNLVIADLADAGERRRLVRSVSESFGPVDVLVNNAGIGTGAVRRDFIENPVKSWEVDEAGMRHFFEVNALVPHLLAMEFLPSMLERGFGRIVNIGTSLGNMLRPGMSGYGASKAALEANTAVLAAELSDTAVTVNILAPGGMADTSMIPVNGVVDRAELVPPEAMVAPAIWLSSSAADFFTGRRVIARKWRSDLPGAEAAERASWPIGWPETAI